MMREQLVRKPDVSNDREKSKEAKISNRQAESENQGRLITFLAGNSSQPSPATQADRVWDDGFLDGVIDEFLLEIPQVTKELGKALSSVNFSRLQTIAHRLRGVADVLGSAKLSASAQDVEQAGKAKNLDLTTCLTPKLISELHKLTAAVSDHLLIP